VTASCSVLVADAGFDGVAMTVITVELELDWLPATDVDEEGGGAPPPHPLKPAARAMTARTVAYRRRCVIAPRTMESSRNAPTNPDGVLEKSDADCAVRTRSVVETEAVPLALTVAGENEH
jgi:hypothetical protein